MGPSHLGRLAVGDVGPLVMTIGGEVDDPVVGVWCICVMRASVRHRRSAAR